MREEPTAVRPQEMQIPPEAIRLVTRQAAERFNICPIALHEVRNGAKTLSIATTDVRNVVLFDQLQQLTKCRIHPLLASQEDIRQAIAQHYTEKEQKYAEAPTDLLGKMGDDVAVAGEAPVVSGGVSKTVETILQKAIAERASDIHIEPHPKAVYVRFRVDGVMYDHTTYPPSQHAQVISRVKILAKLDISQNRLAHDGHFEMVMGNGNNKKEYDVRVSTIPAVSGEKAVLRILTKGPMAMDFDELGIMGTKRALLEDFIKKPYGMILATGPTGSGKTTSLYASLSKINCVEKNVITIEDPVEYQFSRITQIEVRAKIGMTFAAGLRSILRQDPDIIMVGEIRDLETLQIAMQSSLTGHLVFSTLHCNDAASCAVRMVDMGAEPFLVSSSVSGIIAQRLVRRICPDCKEEAAISDIVRQRLNLSKDEATFYHGKGCENCRHTGYLGRVGLFEVMPMTERLQEAVIRKAMASEIRAIMREEQIPTLIDDGLEKARAGQVSLEEVMRAVFVDVG